MQINNRLITSVEEFQKHFAIHEVYEKLDAFIRDCSPEKICYKNDEVILYQIIKTPENYFCDNQGFSDGQDNIYTPAYSDKHTINLKILQKNCSTVETIRLLALLSLAKADIILPHNFKIGINIDAHSVTLYNGKSLSIDKKKRWFIQGNLELCDTHLVSIKSIFNSSYKNSSRVGKYELKPRSYTYGLFYENNLIAVNVPSYISETFSISFNREKYMWSISHVIGTKVEKKDEEPKILFTPTWYPIGDDNFVYIKHGRVCLFNDSPSWRTKCQKSIDTHEAIFIEGRGSFLCVWLDDLRTIDIII